MIMKVNQPKKYQQFFFYKIIFLLLFINLINPVHSQSVLRSELLGRPTNNSITIQLFFNIKIEARVEYGTVSGIYPNQTTWQTFNDSIAEIIVTGLQADTKYFYRVNYRTPGTIPINYRPQYSFQTARSVLSTFKFVVEADPHLDEQSDTAVYNRCLQNQLEDAPDFMIDLGDFLMTDKLKNASNIIPRDTIPYRCNLFRSYYEKLCHTVPLFISLGNHEGEAGWNLNNTANNIAVWGTLDRKKYFLNPAPDAFYSGDTTNHNYVGKRENYYAWTWGNALFIVIDPYWYTMQKPGATTGWYWTLGKTQYDWLKKTLETSTAKFKFMFAHQIVGGDADGRGGVEFANLYEWGGNNLDGTPGFATNRPGWYKPIKDLLKENRVTIFFHGHDHFFGKQDKDCLIYQETPQPSHPNYQPASYPASYGYVQGQILPNSGHIRTTVSSTGVLVEYVRTYKASDTSSTRHNKDVSASYFIGTTNCYDSTATAIPILWNSNYSDEIVYPNPFSKQTKIEFSVTNSENTYLYIYNQGGQLVRKLLDGRIVNPGKFQIVWDGKSDNGTNQPNGIYWYQLKGKFNGNKSGKMVLIR